MESSIRSIPVFPLPGVVLFPGTVQPLHVFEPRYRDMVRAALASRQELALALLEPGWEGDYEGTPPVHPIGCAGEIRNVVTLPDGRYVFDLAGTERVRFESWDQLLPFRIARCRPDPERAPAAPSGAAEEFQVQLAATFEALLHELKGETGPLAVDSGATLEKTVNGICSALDLNPETKQRLLEESDLFVRGRIVAAYLEAILRALAASRSPGEQPPVD